MIIRFETRYYCLFLCCWWKSIFYILPLLSTPLWTRFKSKGTQLAIFLVSVAVTDRCGLLCRNIKYQSKYKGGQFCSNTYDIIWKLSLQSREKAFVSISYTHFNLQFQFCLKENWENTGGFSQSLNKYMKMEA